MNKLQFLFVIAALLLSPAAAFTNDGEAHLDAHGDPLPPGVSARLGTSRLKHTGPIGWVEFDKSGKIVGSTARDGSLRIWDSESGRQLKRIPLDLGLSTSGTFLGGERVAIAAGDGTVVLYSHSDGRLISNWRKLGNIVCASPGSSIFYAATNGEAKRVNAFSGEVSPLAKTDRRMDPVWMAISSDGTRLAWVGFNRSKAMGRADTSEEPSSLLLVFETKTGRLMVERPFQDGNCSRPVFGPAGELFVADSGGVLLQVDTSNGEVLHRFGAEGAASSMLAGAGSELVRCGTGGLVERFSMGKGEPLKAWQLRSSDILQHAVSPDASRLVVAEGLHLRLFDLATGIERPRFDSHRSPIACMAYSPDGNRLASGGNDGQLLLWDTQLGRVAGHFDGHLSVVYGLAFSGDGKRLISGGRDGFIRLWDSESMNPIALLGQHEMAIFDVAIAADGSRMGAVAADGTARLWDADGKETLRIKGLRGVELSLAFSPDGEAVATAGKELQLWRTEDGKELHDWREFKSPLTCLAFSPDGGALAVGEMNRRVTLFEVASGEKLFSLDGHLGRVLDLAFDPSGKRIATISSGSNLVRLWSAGDGRLLDELEGYESLPMSIAFSPDGKHIAVGGLDTNGVILEIPAK